MLQTPILSHDLIGEIYEASSRPMHWQTVLSAIAQDIKADSATLLYRNFENPESDVSYVHTNQSPEECTQMVMEYESHYHRLDPMWKLTTEIAEVGVGIADSLLGLSRKEYEANCPPEYLENYMRKYNRWHVGGSYIFQDESKVLVLAVQRGIESNPWTAKDMDYITSLTPHFQRAFRIHHEFVELRNSEQYLSSCMNRLLMGVIILRPNGKIEFINELANKIICENPVLANKNGFLKAMPMHNDNELQQLIKQIFSDTTNSENANSTENVAALALRTDNSSAPLPMLLTPAIIKKDASEQTSNEKPPTTNHIAIFFADPKRAQEHSQDVISQFYGLTRAEAGVAIAISNGYTVAEYANKNNVTEYTVRTQVKQIFQKLEVSRQAELVKVLLQTPNITVSNYQQKISEDVGKKVVENTNKTQISSTKAQSTPPTPQKASPPDT